MTIGYPISPTIAWGDESARMNNSPRMYLMCATVFEPGSERQIADFAATKPPGMRKLHWYDMDLRERSRSLGALAAIPHWSTVAIAAPMLPGVRQERGRRKCLERLLPHLEGLGVERLVLESRWKQEDQFDVDMVAALRSRKMIGKIWVEHVRPDAGEPRLWVPDQVLGAVGDVLCGFTDNWMRESAWDEIDNRITLLMETVH